MTEKGIEKKGTAIHLNVGDIAHLAEIAVVVVALFGFYAKVDQAMKAVESHSAQLQRIEHYLSSKDANYWKLSRENE